MTRNQMVGANLADLRRLAADFDAAADQLEAEARKVSTGMKSTSWFGKIADEFRRVWAGVHLVKVHALANELHDAARTLRANADDQQHASGGSGAPAPKTAPPVAPVPAAPVAPSAPGGGVMGHRDWHEVEQKYDAWAKGRFAKGGVSYYQCTAWSNFRWRELGYRGPDINGNGADVAANAARLNHESLTTTPSIHAIGSAGTSGYGHTFVVEDVSADGKHIRISEMNVGDRDYEHGHPNEYRDSLVLNANPDGSFTYPGIGLVHFAALPV